ncbi:aspartate aminotransferase [Parabacteroides sp. PFB2-12]|uniref:pyridoxal phosphate-dependent aminotransferase n=1 Tax=unclassified Parabacteroides TaxID=2649774 RepID=UPI002476E20B|nr:MULTISPECIES: pyridoxal phosphate-dependent aminotransferase [unclassified Parabacteroides]MDH6341445.1 aspartate aminotransferase [Parabacteroides sp. PM6-13]MDH6389239.1 aspartate aminotransferase [Parabacteroides sp. PFB2-12]
MTQVSDRLASLSPSETLAMSQKSQELKAQGIDVINLSVGEPDFFTPDHIKEAAKKAIDDNFSFYSPVPGYMDLRKAIVDKLKRENDLDYTTDQIIVSGGAKQSVCNVLLSIVGPGDEVIVPAPYWVSYVEMVKLAEGTNVIVEAGIDQDFKITPAQLEAAITPKTKALILCSPSNPTGSVYSQEELRGLAEVLAKHPNVIVLADEIYEHINYIGKHQSIAQFSEIKDRVVVINGVSKAYAMTGWRIGFIAAPLWIAKACNKLQGQYTSGASSIAQKASVAAFNGDQTCVEQMREAFLRRRDLVINLCKDIPGIKLNVPQGAFYVFPEMDYYFGKSAGDRAVNDASDLAMYLLEVGHVATVGGAAFGAPKCLRFSYATSDENLIEAISRMKKALANLK